MFELKAINLVQSNRKKIGEGETSFLGEILVISTISGFSINHKCKKPNAFYPKAMNSLKTDGIQGVYKAIFIIILFLSPFYGRLHVET